MSRAIRWALMNGLGAWVCWAALVADNPYALTFLKCWVWFVFAVSLCLFSSTVSAQVRKKGPSVPLWLDLAYDVCVVAFLVWHGQPLLAGAFGFSTLLHQGVYMEKRA